MQRVSFKIIFSVLFFLSLSIPAQDVQINSKKHKDDNKQNPSCLIYKKLAKQNINQNQFKSAFFAKKALTFAKDSDCIAELNDLLGFFYFRIVKCDSAFYYYNLNLNYF